MWRMGWVVALVVAAGFGVAEAPGQEADQAKRFQAKAQVEAARAEWKRAEAMYKEAAISKFDLGQSRLVLEKALHRLAVVQKQATDKLLPHLEQIVALTKERLEKRRELREQQVVTQEGVYEAGIELSEAVIKLELTRIVQYRELSLRNLERLLTINEATAQEVAVARKALEEARRKAAERDR